MFQFYCPHGHLLQGDPSQMGQPTDCPMCGTRFLIPVVENYGHGAVEEESPGYGYGSQFDQFPQQAEEDDRSDDFTRVGAGHSASLYEEEEPQETIWHIPCPNGHELETPDDMIGQEVLCPQCGEQFLLRQQDSIESKRRREEEQARRDQKIGKRWFNWAIAMAVIVVLGLVTLMIIQAQQ